MADKQEQKETPQLDISDEAKAFREELEKCKTQCEEYLNGWKRAKADLINYQKDETKRFEEFAKYASKELIRELITVMDSFDLAIAAMASSAQGSGGPKGDKVDKGTLMIRTQLEDVLKKQGLERIPVTVGDAFDPGVHEAVAAVESAELPGTVIEEVERGYMLNGRVIRPARVKVAREQENKEA